MTTPIETEIRELKELINSRFDQLEQKVNNLSEGVKRRKALIHVSLNSNLIF